ncbi:MAG: signal peptide peptidase SppA [Desulfarculus sp.]|jgi:protease-4|nr:MAG: signal peptide peptidase SppA [Desulfarculus sp.]
MKKHPLLLALGVCALIVAVFAGGLLLIKQRGAPVLFSGKVGVVPVYGLIEYSRPFNESLIKFRRDSSIKAIVIRMESGGGGVAASQEMYREVARTARVKPVVGSMGGVAASGGYYVLAPCSKIMAMPGTLTGSIGVIINIPDAQELLQKIGLKVQTMRSGDLKGAGLPSRPLSEAERRNIQQLIDETHKQFVVDVAKARRLDPAEVAKIANGGVFTGQRAKQLGLVDAIGNFEDAVDLAARLGGVKGRPELVWPSDAKKSWLVRMLRDELRSLIRDVLGELGGSSGLQYRYQPPSPAP